MFIKDLTCISPQQTFRSASSGQDEGDFFDTEPIVYSGSQLKAIEPSYSGMIPNSQLRRMGKSNRMATGSGMPLLTKWDVDGIIIGSTDGGMEDCHKFLNQIIAYDEGTLTPTGFVQGSPSSPAGGLALMAKNSGYNNTHSNKGLSFENCLVDAMLLFDEGSAKRLFVGNVEEISQAQFRIGTLAGHIKLDEVSTDRLFESETRGAVKGEGAAMFILEPTPDNAIAEIKDVDMISYPSKEDVSAKVKGLLERNGLTAGDIDAVMLGYSGDATLNHWYDDLSEEFFPETGKVSFKNLFGENPSASAFATWFAAQLLNGKKTPDMAVLKPLSSELKTMLIYNVYQNSQHGFVLMRRV